MTSADPGRPELAPAPPAATAELGPAPQTARAELGPARPAPAAAPSAPTGRARLAVDIAAAVEAVPGAVLTAGQGVALATQFRGGSVAGVRLDDESVTVQIVARTVPLPSLVDAVHVAAAQVLRAHRDGRAVLVHVADLDWEAVMTGGPA